jgi:hypothetical protein
MEVGKELAITIILLFHMVALVQEHLAAPQITQPEQLLTELPVILGWFKFLHIHKSWQSH